MSQQDDRTSTMLPCNASGALGGGISGPRLCGNETTAYVDTVLGEIARPVMREYFAELHVTHVLATRWQTRRTDDWANDRTNIGSSHLQSNRLCPRLLRSNTQGTPMHAHCQLTCLDITDSNLANGHRLPHMIPLGPTHHQNQNNICIFDQTNACQHCIRHA